jgi:hypothetical protein
MMGSSSRSWRGRSSPSTPSPTRNGCKSSIWRSLPNDGGGCRERRAVRGGADWAGGVTTGRSTSGARLFPV